MIHNRFLRGTALASATALLISSTSPEVAGMLVAPTALVVALAACSTGTTTVTPAQVVADVDAFATVLEGFANTDLPPAVAASVTYWANFAEGIASQLASADTSTAVTLFNSLLKVAPGILAAFATAGLAVPTPVSIAVAAFTALVPTLESLLGIASTSDQLAAAAMTSMSPAQARAALGER